ncbi:MAG TPA: hypothetical protein VHM29_09060 [Acidimicrobiia bacterium]|nr:hypothetical protein [Acidimicrobiia bacterium]
MCEPFIVAYVEAQGVASRASLVEAITGAWEQGAGTSLPEGFSVGRVKKALSNLASDGVVSAAYAHAP